MLAFFQTVFTFYHQGFELAKDFEHYKRALQINIQNVRNSLTFLLQLSFLLKINSCYLSSIYVKILQRILSRWTKTLIS